MDSKIEQIKKALSSGPMTREEILNGLDLLTHQATSDAELDAALGSMVASGTIININGKWSFAVSLANDVLTLQIKVELLERNDANFLQAFQETAKQIESLKADILNLDEKGKQPKAPLRRGVSADEFG